MVLESFYARLVVRWPGSNLRRPSTKRTGARLAASVQFLVLHHSPVRYAPRTGPTSSETPLPTGNIVRSCGIHKLSLSRSAQGNRLRKLGPTAELFLWHALSYIAAQKRLFAAYLTFSPPLLPCIRALALLMTSLFSLRFQLRCP